jgi:phosphoribosyl 1,2-cyclic phosphodiesterase
MMRMTVLASGSKGNSTVVSSSRTRILVDAGLSCRELLKRMRIAGEDPDELDAILVTHEHQDHVQGVGVLARKLGIPVYFTEATHRAWVRWMTPHKRLTYADWLEQRQQEAAQRRAEIDNIEQDEARPGSQERDLGHLDSGVAREMLLDEVKGTASDFCDDDEPVIGKSLAALPALEFFAAGQQFSIGDISVTSFTIPHDAADPVGFVFAADGVRIGIATDLGYMPPNAKLALRGCDVLMLESNHDLEMLRDGPYPWSVKQRVMSRVGHLSNDAAAEFLEKNYDGTAAYVVLAHLSQSNNLPELARLSAERALCDRISLLANKLLLAEQDQPMAPILL